MESVNTVILSGTIEGNASIRRIDNDTEECRFSVRSYRAKGRGDDKVKVSEVHRISLLNPKTIARHLTNGKSVIVQGRLIPPSESTGSTVFATKVTFNEPRVGPNE